MKNLSGKRTGIEKYWRIKQKEYFPQGDRELNVPEHAFSEQYGEWKILRSSALLSAEAFSIIHAHESRKENHEVRVLKEGRKSTLYLLPVFLGQKKRILCVKHYQVQGRVTSLKNILLPSRAMSSFKAAQHFQSLGINTARPLAVGEKRQKVIRIESVLVMEDISQHLGFPEYIAKNFSPPLSRDTIKQKRTFIKEVAFYIKQLHTQGIYTSDLKTTNIFVEDTSSGKRAFWLIDLDHVLFLKRVSKRRKIKNLGQINTSIPAEITLTDRLRFYHHYTGKKHLEDEDKGMIRAIIRLSWKRNPCWHPRFGMDARLIRNWE